MGWANPSVPIYELGGAIAPFQASLSSLGGAIAPFYSGFHSGEVHILQYQ
jgi:hypothetical protein